MKADGILSHATDVLCNPVSDDRGRLDAARQAHMLAIQGAIAGSVVSMGEISHDMDAFNSAVRQLVFICGTTNGKAPMFLRAHP